MPSAAAIAWANQPMPLTSEVTSEFTSPMSRPATNRVANECHQWPPTSDQERAMARVPRRPSTTKAWHRTDRYANNRVECDHGRLKARLGPMRGLKQDRSARVVIAGPAFVQSLRRGHYELVVEEPTNRRVADAFDELVLAI